MSGGTLDYSNERYVRIYTRDTMTWKLLGWEGQTVLCLLARKFDRAGLLEGVTDGEDVAVMLDGGFPVDVAERGLSKLLRKDKKTGESVLVLTERGLYWPKFMDAQETPKSDAQRQRESREKRKADAASQIVTEKAEVVTNRDNMSQPVTACHSVSQPVTPNLPVPSCSVPSDPSLTKTNGRVARGKPARPKTDGSLVWEAYSSAYEKRYGTLPVRNAKTNTMCARFVELVGADSAPEVAAYYLTSRNAWYVQRGHNLESLVADAGKLHTEWATGNRITQTRAREDDRLQETGDMWARIKEEFGE